MGVHTMGNVFDLNQPLSKTAFAVFDVETTGLSPAYGHRVCEVGCLRVQGDEELGRFESLVDPQRPISPGAFRVNRITAEMLDGAPTFEAIAGSLLQVLEGAVLVAHNAPFDLGFLAAELEMARLPLPQTLAVDTLTLVRRAYRLARNSLPAVADALGVEVRQAHRAIDDVQTTCRVLERLLGDLERQQRITTLDQLLEFQGGSVPYPHSRVLPLPPAIAEALASRGRVRMRYVDARGRETERVVSPLHVRAQRGHLYLVAHCYRRDARRTFRLDRVVDMVPEA
jgi:DNA polymerase-3 subunit epsilon